MRPAGCAHSRRRVRARQLIDSTAIDRGEDVGISRGAGMVPSGECQPADDGTLHAAGAKRLPASLERRQHSLTGHRRVSAICPSTSGSWPQSPRHRDDRARSGMPAVPQHQSHTAPEILPGGTRLLRRPSAPTTASDPRTTTPRCSAVRVPAAESVGSIAWFHDTQENRFPPHPRTIRSRTFRVIRWRRGSGPWGLVYTLGRT